MQARLDQSVRSYVPLRAKKLFHRLLVESPRSVCQTCRTYTVGHHFCVFSTYDWIVKPDCSIFLDDYNSYFRCPNILKFYHISELELEQKAAEEEERNKLKDERKKRKKERQKQDKMAKPHSSEKKQQSTSCRYC